MVLDYFRGNTGDVRRLPRKHVDVRPQESNERAFLFRVKRGSDGEGTTSAVLLGGHLLGLGWSCHRLLALAGGARCASSTVAQHSEEVRLPEWASEFLPDLVLPFPASVSRSAAAAASR